MREPRGSERERVCSGERKKKREERMSARERKKKMGRKGLIYTPPKQGQDGNLIIPF